MNTNLIYSGVLNIETASKKYQRHNMGTSNLFKLFSMLLCAEEIPAQSLPGYFMLYNRDYKEIVTSPDVKEHSTVALLRNCIDIRSSYSSYDADGHHSNFTSLIETSHLLNTTSNYDDKLSLGLISYDKTKILAAVEFDNEVYTTIRQGGQAIVKWIMSVSNSPIISR